MGQDTTVGQQTYRDLAQSEVKLQKQVMKLSEENIELRFQCEQASKDGPRLKVSTSRNVMVIRISLKLYITLKSNCN